MAWALIGAEEGRNVESGSPQNTLSLTPPQLGVKKMGGRREFRPPTNFIFGPTIFVFSPTIFVFTPTKF